MNNALLIPLAFIGSVAIAGIIVLVGATLFETVKEKLKIMPRLFDICYEGGKELCCLKIQ